VRRPRALIATAPVALALMLAACGGGSNPPPSNGAEAPGEGATPSSPGALPPEFLECMADQGFEVSSADDIHSAPPQVVQECFGALHQGGGAP
jgi:hypothetical protein